MGGYILDSGSLKAAESIISSVNSASAQTVTKSLGESVKMVSVLPASAEEHLCNVAF